MNYELRLSARAKQDMANIPDACFPFVVERLNDLAESPTSHARATASPPHPPGLMLGHFDWRDEGRWVAFDVFFRYSQDERYLEIAGIGCYELENRPERMDDPDPDGWLED